MKGQQIDNYLAGLLCIRHSGIKEITNIYGAILVKTSQSRKDARDTEEEMEQYGWRLTKHSDDNTIWLYDTGPVMRG